LGQSPLGMQRLLNSAMWDEDAVRDRLVRYVAAELGDPAAVLIAHETGFEKSGTFSAGTQRQYTGTVGQITNSQVGVFLVYAVPSAGVRVLADRVPYVPKSWTDDRHRCGQAGIGEEVKFATKSELARKVIARAIALGLPFAWFIADEACGDNGRLREWLEEEKIAYVVAVSCDLDPAGADIGGIAQAGLRNWPMPSATTWERTACT
jgi:SRSO17 transposase